MNNKDMNIRENIGERIKMRTVEWKDKANHSKYYLKLNSEEIDKEMSCEWIRRGGVFPEPEGFMFAIQDLDIPINNYRKVILKNATVVDRYRK